MYQLDREEKLHEWLADQPDSSKRERMLEFMAELAERPTALGIRVPDTRKPLYVAPTPVDNWVVRYLVVEQFNTRAQGPCAFCVVDTRGDAEIEFDAQFFEALAPGRHSCGNLSW